MRITKINITGSDYLISDEAVNVSAIVRLLDRKSGIGASGFVQILQNEENDGELRLFGKEKTESTGKGSAAIAAAKFLYDKDKAKKKYTFRLSGNLYTVRLSTLRDRVLCAWVSMPPIVPKPMEQLKYYHGIRGEVLRACIVHPRVSVYELCGSHAVFLLESCSALRALDIKSVCKRLCEVLFYGESIDLHFTAIAGDNELYLRSYSYGAGEVNATGEGAVLCAYAAREYEIVDAERVIVKCDGGSFCVDIAGEKAALCAKCETVFCGEAI